MMDIIKFLDVAEILKSEILLETITDETLEKVYCESVDCKKKYSLAYERLSNEFTKRKDLQIQMADSEHCEALFNENVVSKEVKNNVQI